MDKETKELIRASIKLDMASRHIRFKDVAEMFGVSPQAIQRQLKVGFSANKANLWAEMFGYNPVFLLTGRGSLRITEPRKDTIKGSSDDEVLVFASGESFVAKTGRERFLIGYIHCQQEMINNLIQQTRQNPNIVKVEPDIDILPRMNSWDSPVSNATCED